MGREWAVRAVSGQSHGWEQIITGRDSQGDRLINARPGGDKRDSTGDRVTDLRDWRVTLFIAPPPPLLSSLL